MRQQGRRSRSLAAAIVGIAGCAVLGLPATAQTAEEAIASCRNLPTDAERIACLEAALINDDTPQAAPAPSAPASQPSGRRGFRLLAAVPFLGGDVDEDAPQARADASNAITADDLGTEQVATRQPAGGTATRRAPDARIVAAVVSTREIPYKRLEVELDNGQVWRQTQSGDPWNFSHHRDPEDVEISRSGFGGYRMRVPEHNITIAVERIR
jgi:hypothetical protein